MTRIELGGGGSGLVRFEEVELGSSLVTDQDRLAAPEAALRPRRTRGAGSGERGAPPRRRGETRRSDQGRGGGRP